MSLVIPELRDTLSLCYQSTGVFGKTFDPEAFPTQFEDLHRDILRVIDSPSKKKAIAAPRGTGKTTIIRQLCKKAILFHECKFIVYVMNEHDIAAMQTEAIKRDLLTNPEIKKIFGSISIDTDDPEFDETFSKKAWAAWGDILVLPRGAHQQIRGLIYKNHRPGLIVIDDLEKKELLENPENRKKLKNWYRSDLEKCIDRYSNDWRIVYIDTVKHSDSLMEDLLADPDYESVRLELCDDSLHSNVPAMFSDNEIKAEYESHRNRGELDIFYMEYRNQPIAAEDRGFKQDYFKYYEESEIDKKNIESFIIGDPAKTVNMRSADSAVACIGIDYTKGCVYVRDLVCEKMHPDEFYETIFSMRRRMGARVVGIEVTGLDEFIRQPFMNEMVKRKEVFDIVWLKARAGTEDEKGKVKRIGSLVPYYRLGYMYHNRGCCTKLENQLIPWPRGKLVDAADCVAYFIELTEIGERFFNGSVNDDQQEHPEDDEEIYASIDYDEPLDGWQVI
jgi:hypothetical protein